MKLAFKTEFRRKKRKKKETAQHSLPPSTNNILMLHNAKPSSDYDNM